MDKPVAKTAGFNLRELLLSLAPLTSEDLDKILAERTQGKSLVEAIVAAGKMDEEALLGAIGERLGLPFVRISEMELDRQVIGKLQPKVVFQHMVVPIKADNGTLCVATNDPFNDAARSAIGWVTGLRVEMALATRSEIEKAQKRYYGVGAETLEQMLQTGQVIDIAADERLSITDLDEASQEASVVKFVNQIIAEAKRDRATDIHVEPMEDDLRIRYRIDGVLIQVPVPAVLKRIQASIISRIKVMSNMDIAEKRLPQDGAINVRVGGEQMDIRVSTVPSIHGESVSLRLLARSTMLMGLDKLGMTREEEKMFRRLIDRPHGILLVTGPTGSGKSTTLYACLSTINTIDQRIMTVEDPVENQLAGIIQIQVRPDIGLTFARGLRHILRQDPDIIMVGEVRDLETAEIAVRAALTGHLVFATLHTNDAPSGFTRLIDMGIEPFLITSSVDAIIAQRLVRTLCPSCKVEDKPSELIELIGICFFAAACTPRCAGEGMFGAFPLERDYYYHAGKQQGHYPADAALGLETGHAPALARLICLEGADETSYQEAEQHLAETGGIHVSARQIQRMVQRVGVAAQQWQEREAQPGGNAVPILYVSADGTGVPMRPEVLAGRAGKQPDGTAKTRMAYLGCVFTQHQCDEKGHPVRDYESATYVSSFGPIEEFGPCLRQDAIRRGLALALQVVLLIDGAEALAHMGRLCFPGATQIVDFYHALEHAGRVLVALLGSKDHPACKTRLGRWAKRLLNDRVEQLIAQARAECAGKPQAAAVEKELGYFVNNVARMQYGTFRTKGFFIGSGVIEAGCKTVIGPRCKQSGMFWNRPGAEHVLALRCIHSSRRLNAFWKDRLNSQAARNDSLALAA